MDLSRHSKRLLSIFTLSLLSLSFLAPAFLSASAFETGQAADAVLGQTTYSTTINPTTSLRIPSNFAFDSSGNLWIADAGNNRVLEETNVGVGHQATVGTVLGQPTLTTGFAAVTKNGIYNPSGMAFDSSGNLWLTDTSNNRVLEYATPFVNAQAASVVIGQANFTTSDLPAASSGTLFPAAVTFDSSGNMWVVDGGNNRVLEFKAPFTSGMQASLVIGQPNLSTTVNATAQNTLNFPTSARFDSSGNLWVADGGNNRVLEFQPPFTSGMNASLVLGQSTYTALVNGTSQTGLWSPGSLAFDSTGNLWVADTYNSRVLEFAAPFSSGEKAAAVLGQSSFTTGSSSTTSSGMSSPTEVGFDKAGNLWVADSFNNRVLEFAAPIKSGAAASYIIGQSDYVSNVDGGQENLYAPTSVSFDSSGNLWVVDGGNNRVVEFKSPVSSSENASLAIGQPSLTLSNEGNSSSGLYSPFAAVFDKSGNLWVSDYGNNRVLEFKAPFSTGMSASLVIGQASFATIASGTSAASLSFPAGLAFDSSGDLWVADSGNNRVLEFQPPFATGMSASLVLGQSGFTTGIPGETSNRFYSPMGLAFDSSGNLWVADSGNSRVLGFAQPLSTNEASSISIGEAGYVSAPPAVSSSSLYVPLALAFDKAGDLWVSSTNQERVLEFSGVLSSGARANLVIGQPSFLTELPGTSQTGFYSPLGLAFDSSGNLWVADATNDRILSFSAAVVGTSSSTSSTQSSIVGSTSSSATSSSATSSKSTSSAVTSSSHSTTSSHSATSTSGSLATSTSSSSASLVSQSSSSSTTSSSTNKGGTSDTTYILIGVAAVVLVLIVAGIMNGRRTHY